MLPLGVANNLIPPRPNLPPVIPPFGQNDLGSAPSNRFQLDPAGSVHGAPPVPSYPINNNNPARVSGLGAEGGLAALAGIQNSPPAPIGAGFNAGNSVPSSLSSSGSLANLGILPQKFEPPKQEIDLASSIGLDSNLPTPTFAPPTLPKPDAGRDQSQGITHSFVSPASC